MLLIEKCQVEVGQSKKKSKTAKQDWETINHRISSTSCSIDHGAAFDHICIASDSRRLLLACRGFLDRQLHGRNLSWSFTPSTTTRRRLDDNFFRVNLVVALCNASGTLIATYCGDPVKQIPERAPKKLAATVSTSSSPEDYVPCVCFSGWEGICWS